MNGLATQSFCETLVKSVWHFISNISGTFCRLLVLQHLLHGLRVAAQEKLSVVALDWRPFTSKNAEIPTKRSLIQAIHPAVAMRKQENTECSSNTTTQMSSCKILCSLGRLQRGEMLVDITSNIATHDSVATNFLCHNHQISQTGVKPHQLISIAKKT